MHSLLAKPRNCKQPLSANVDTPPHSPLLSPVNKYYMRSWMLQYIQQILAVLSRAQEKPGFQGHPLVDMPSRWI